ncbi:MAG: helix-turn-helix transcriptional regulator [Peptococcaceae bacterium]|nr:helix-turn-helix transcriptional regulator [Peptococcaceae bacterium]
MNAQFKKGVLELVVLLSLAKKDMSGYEIVSEVSKIIEVNEGTIYPLLKRLTNEKYFETYLRESTEGPPRKYYHLTKVGEMYKDELKNEYLVFHESVMNFIKECD